MKDNARNRAGKKSSFVNMLLCNYLFFNCIQQPVSVIQQDLKKKHRISFL